MKRALRKITSILLMLFIVFGVASCKKKPSNNGTGGNTTTTENVIFSPKVDAVIVLGDGVVSDDVSAIRNYYYERLGRDAVVKSASAAPSAHEIIVGKTDRALSQKAYRALELLEKGEEDYVGYVIYSDGNSIALAFDDAKWGIRAAFEEVISVFTTYYMQTSTLKTNSGLLTSKAFDSIKWQEEKENEELEYLWNFKVTQISAKFNNNEELASEIVEELRDLHGMLNRDHKTVIWLANLYDPASGGFYYSNSARNNQGYLPDLVSTSQALGLVEAMLVGYEGNLTDYFGEEIAENFVRFVKAMQSPTNGYFYHPQWSQEVVDKNMTRRTYDLVSAVNILECFGASPTYNTPNGIVGDGIMPVASQRLTEPMKMSGVAAVSAIANDTEDEIYIPPHLSSKELFDNYIKSLNISTNAASAADALAKDAGQILAIDAILKEENAGYSLVDICINALSKYQNSDTGLWSKSKIVSAEDIKGVSKIASLYSTFGRIVPNSDKIINCIIDYVLDADSSIEDIDTLSDGWSAIAAVSSNVDKCSTANDQYKKQLTLDTIFAHFPQLVKTTRDQLLKHSNLDGSFSSLIGLSSSDSYGMQIAVPSTAEGDVNATLVATTNMWLSMFGSLRIASVPAFNVSDRMSFQKTLLDMGVIVKNEIVSSAPIDFENEDVGETTTSATTTFTSGGSSATIVAGDKGHGNVLNIKSPKDSSADYVYFDLLQTAKGATCNILDLDICVNQETESGAFANIYLYRDMYMFSLNREGDTIRIYEESARSDANSVRHDIGHTAKVGEWFNIRIEYYVGDASTVRIKLFFNGECIAVTDNFFGVYKLTDPSVNPVKDYSRVEFRLWGGKNVDISVDNIIAEQSYKMYVPETGTNGKLVRNVDAPDKKQNVHDFDAVSGDKIPSAFTTSGDVSVIGVIKNEDGGQLSFKNGDAKLYLPLDERGTKSNSGVLNFALTVDASSEAGAIYDINFNEFGYKSRMLLGFRLLVISENGNRYAVFAESKSGATGTIYDNTKISLGEAVNISICFYLDSKAATLQVNDEMIAINSSVLLGMERAYMGEVTISCDTPGVKSEILIDNLVCERIRADFATDTEPTVERVTHTFDSLDGIVSNGVSANGNVSFNSAGANAYVKIPVLNRSTAITLNYVSIDIKSIGGRGSDLVIAMVDKVGNIIASFALSAAEDGVAIYEYTENGKYKSSLCIVGGSEFTLVIERDPIKNMFNLYKGDKYLASTSVTYTLDCDAGSFDYLMISSNGSSGFVIDNAVCENLSGLFKIPTDTPTNADDTNKVIAFEGSSFASITSKITKSFASGISALSIKEGKIRGEVSRVLEFTTGSDGADLLTLGSLTNGAATGNAVGFEGDIMLMPASNRFDFYVNLREVSRSACEIYFSIKDGIITIESKHIKKSIATDLKVGEWFTLRFEYADTVYDYNYDGLKDVVTRVFVNGEKVAEGYTSAYPEDNPTASTVTQVRFGVGTNHEGKAYLDNLCFERFNMIYDAPIPADTHTLTYEPGVVTDKSIGVLKSKNSSLNVSTFEAIGKVLSLVSNSGGEDTIRFRPTATLDGANGVSFETELMIDPTTDVASFYLEPATSALKQSFRLNIKAAKNGNVTISAIDIPETVIGRSGEWIKIRVEYMCPRVDYNGDNVDDILYRVYIDDSDTPIATGYKTYASGAYYLPSSIYCYNFVVEKNSSANVYFDNTKIWQENLIPDEAPEQGGEGDIFHPGHNPSEDIFDNNGWN